MTTTDDIGFLGPAPESSAAIARVPDIERLAAPAAAAPNSCPTNLRRRNVDADFMSVLLLLLTIDWRPEWPLTMEPLGPGGGACVL